MSHPKTAYFTLHLAAEVLNAASVKSLLEQSLIVHPQERQAVLD